MITTGKLYINTDIDIPIIFPGGFDLDTLIDVEATFSLVSNPSTSQTYKKTTGGITIRGNDVVVLIKEGDITNTGEYLVSIRITDSFSGYRGLTPDPEVIIFY